MTGAEAAKILKRTEGGVRYLIRSGRLRARRVRPCVSRVWEIRPGDLGRIRYGKRGRPVK